MSVLWFSMRLSMKRESVMAPVPGSSATAPSASEKARCGAPTQGVISQRPLRSRRETRAVARNAKQEGWLTGTDKGSALPRIADRAYCSSPPVHRWALSLLTAGVAPTLEVEPHAVFARVVDVVGETRLVGRCGWRTSSP